MPQPRLRQRTHGHGSNHGASDSHSHQHGGRCCSRLRVSTTFRFSGVIAVATCFFFGELIVGILMRSLALVADAFHILSDLLGYAVALAAYRFSKRKDFPTAYTFGYQKAEILGGFFNGAVLIALGVSIILQSIERFTAPEDVKDPVAVMIVGAAGIASNIVMLLFLGGHDHGGHNHGHDHGHSHGDDAAAEQTESGGSLEMESIDHKDHAHFRAKESGKQSKESKHSVNRMGILLHIFGDAVNSIAVIISAGVYKATGWKYADPLASLLVGIMIISTAYSLVRRSMRDLLQAAPASIEIEGLREDIERITGKDSIHGLHVWTAAPREHIAILHVVVPHDSLSTFQATIEEVRECMHMWGVHNVTVQPEVPGDEDTSPEQSRLATPEAGETLSSPTAVAASTCLIACVTGCGKKAV